MRTILFLLPLLPSAVLAQIKVTGRILDSSSAPVPFAVVVLTHSSDSSILKGTITTENGNFSFDLVLAGNYFLRVNAPGFEVRSNTAFVTDSIHDMNLPDIFLARSAIREAVTVTALKPVIEFKNGNVTVNVEDSPLAKGNSVFELLAKLPGVGIENNTITIQGKPGVIIMIDGRIQQLSDEQLITILKGMSAATIQKIEILKNPPVKYDAAGTSGMINIVTKRSETRGLNGSLYTESSQGFYNNASAGVELNYKNEKISVFTGIDDIYNTYLVNTKLFSNFSSDSGNTQLGNITGYRALEAGPTYKAGIDWHMTRSDIIGFRIDGNQGIYNETGHGKNQVSDQNNMGFDHLFFTEIGHNKWNMLNYNFNAEHRFDTLGSMLDFSADHTSSMENDHSFYSNYFNDVNEQEALPPNIYQNTNDANTQIWSSKLDLTLPMDSTSTLEAGIKSSLTTMTNDYLFERMNNTTSAFYTDTALSNNYRYSEQNLAAYFNYSRTSGSFNFSAGLRGENTIVKGSNNANAIELSKNYFSLFPNISFEYSGTGNHVFQLNMNRRIDRPSYWDLTPFIVYRDQYSYFSGNPFLQPDFSNTIELTDIFKELLTTTISYSHTGHFMLDYTEQNDSTRILLETEKNISYENSISGLIFLKLNPADWYELGFDMDGSCISYKGDINNVPFLTNLFTYRMNLSNIFLLPGKTKLEVDGLYRGPNLFGIVRIDPLWSTSFAFQHSFCKEKLSCSIGMSDVFNTFRFHTHSQFDNQNWNFYQTSDPRRITVSINYSFGKLSIEERENSSNDDEKGRLNH